MSYAASSLKSDIIFNCIIKIVTEGKSFMELHFQQHLVDWNLMKDAYAISVSDAKLMPNQTQLTLFLFNRMTCFGLRGTTLQFTNSFKNILRQNVQTVV